MSFLQKLESKYCVVSGAQEIARKKLKSVKSLEELLEKIQSDARRDEPILSDRDMSNLPTFGGEAPNDTHGVYSWDKTRLLIQTNTGWKIVKRNEQPVGVADSVIASKGAQIDQELYDQMDHAMHKFEVLVRKAIKQLKDPAAQKAAEKVFDKFEYAKETLFDEFYHS